MSAPKAKKDLRAKMDEAVIAWYHGATRLERVRWWETATDYERRIIQDAFGVREDRQGGAP
jgi:hypothetical protein